VAYSLRVEPSVRRAIASWLLPDGVLVEVYLRLQRLQDRPAELLARAEAPFDGMNYAFDFRDPENVARHYFFAFHVVYGQDEERLIVARGACVQHFGIGE
jgi:hypothetical protein